MKILKGIFVLLLFLVVTTLIFSSVLYIKGNKEKKVLTDKDRLATSGKYIRLSQGITHYQLAGPDTGKVIILIHGFSVPYYIWDGTFEFLVNHGFRVLRYDMYGRGYSDRPDVVYNQELYQNQLLGLISGLHLQTPVNVVGVSFGGEVITNFTCRYPQLINKVILIDPGYLGNAPTMPRFYTSFYEASHGDERAEGQLSDFKYPKLHPDWVGKYKTQMQYEGFRNALVSTEYNYQYMGRKSNTCLNNAHKDVLLIWGKEDQTVPFNYSDSIRSVLKADFFPVDDAGHLPHIEQSAKVNNKILDFLQK